MNGTAAGFSNTPAWGTPSSGQCGKCHNGVKGDATVMDTGSHPKHVSENDFPCSFCHSGGGPGSVGNHVDGKIQIIMNSTFGGIYNQGPADTPASGYGSCSGVYCHNASVPNWYYDNGTLDCAFCHKTAWSVPGRHSTHYNTATYPTNRTDGNVSNSTNYIYSCGVCHYGTMHAGGEVDPGRLTAEVFYNTSIAGTGATNTGGSNSWSDVTFNWTDATCSTYCHSDGTSLSSPFTPNDDDFNWATPEFGFGCESCHSSNAAATNTMDSGRHLAHMNSTIEHGDNYECDTCHSDTVDSGDDTFIANKVNHVDTINTVVFNSMILAKNGLASFTQGNDTCDNVYCHSDGADDTSYWTINWDSPPIDCKGCHGTAGGSTLGEPAYTNAGAGIDNANSHTKHVAGQNYECKACHDDTTDTDSHTLANGIHLDGVKNVAIEAAYDTNADKYDNYIPGTGKKTCSDVYCHSTVQNVNATAAPTYLTPTWGGSAICGSCHNGEKGDLSEMDTGSHPKHVTFEGFECWYCHDGGGPANVANHVDGKIQIIMNSTIGGIYNQGPADIPQSGYGQCSSVYCHNTLQPNWYTDNDSLTCGSCHEASSALPGRHNTHYANTLAATNRTGGNESISDQYIYNCGVCHPAMTHARGEVISGELTADVVFNSSIAGTGATNTGGGSSTPDGTFNWTNATCSVYCHSQGDALSGWTGPNNGLFNWATAEFTFDCESCHSSNAGAANTMDSGRHLAHMNSTAEIGDNYECDTCHADTVDSGDDATIADKSNHVDGINTVVFNSVLLALNSSASFTQGNDTCSNLYCHSDGADLTSYWTINWDDPPISCNGCHGIGTSLGDPGYQNTGPGLLNANSHSQHVAVEGFECWYCHDDTTADGSSTFANGIHIDGVKNVAIAAAYDGGGTKYDNFTPGETFKTCVDVSCHGGNSVQWGDAVICDDCHLIPGPDVDNFTFSGFSAGFIQAQINTTDWGQVSGTVYGHGGTTGNLPLACNDCHDPGAAHGGPTNYFRLMNSSDPGGDIPDIDGVTDICYSCHQTGALTNPLAADVGNRVDKFHYGEEHDDTYNGGQFCWDCHDPHGDGNIKMIHSRAHMKTGTYGNPGTLANLTGTTGDATSYIEFTDNTKATGLGGFAMNSVNNTVQGYRYEKGVCNACHEAAQMANDHYTITTSDDHNQGTVCTVCHVHNENSIVDGDAFKGGGCNGCHGYPQAGINAGGHFSTVRGTWHPKYHRFGH